MSIAYRSSSQPLSGPAAATAALVVFFAAWWTLHQGWFARDQIIDLPVYEQYGDAIVQGQMPYRDFAVEYPPAALPVFVVPALGVQRDADGFRRRFEALMSACSAAALLLMAVSLGALRVPPRRRYAMLAFAALAPLLLGSVVLSRFDLWPAALAAGALAALLSGRLRLGHGVLGAAIAAKIWPGVLAPLFLAYVWRTRGRREALLCAAALLGVVLAVVLPFLVLSPGGVWESVVRQTTRPLQIESLGAALLVASHHLFGTGAEMTSSHGSQNLAGGVAVAIGALQTTVQFAVVAAIWVWFARRHRDRAELVRWSAAAVVAFVALGKVLSPQFLIWLLPFVPLVRGRRGAHATALLGLALVLTQSWFPQRYWDYALQFDGATTALVAARDLVLLGLLGVLLAPDWRTWDDAPRARDKPYGATVAVRRGDEWLLLHRAHEGPEYDGDWAWTPPSGARRPGEAIDDCAARELREEAGLDLTLVRVESPFDDWALYVADASEDAVVTLDHTEHDAYVWLPLEQAVTRCRPLRVADDLRAAARSSEANAHELDRARAT